MNGERNEILRPKQFLFFTFLHSFDSSNANTRARRSSHGTHIGHEMKKITRFCKRTSDEAHRNGWSEIQRGFRSPLKHSHTHTHSRNRLYKETTCRNFGVVVCILFVVAACNARKLGEIQLIRRNSRNWRWRQPCPVQCIRLCARACSRCSSVTSEFTHFFSAPLHFLLFVEIIIYCCDIWIRASAADICVSNQFTGAAERKKE